MSPPAPMHFSRVTVEPQGLQRAELAELMDGHAYLQHRLLWRLFPGDGEKRDFLFRAVHEPQRLPRYYVVSARPPVAVPGLLSVEQHPQPYPPPLVPGAALHLSLRANPTVARRVPLDEAALAVYNAGRVAERGKPARPQHGRRRFDDVVMAAKKACGHRPGWQPDTDQLKAVAEATDRAARGWLLERLAGWGLCIRQARDEWTGESCPLLDWSGYEVHRLHRRAGTLVFSSVDYEAEVEVCDPALLDRALREGVGRAKAFGCGLLLLGPARGVAAAG